MQTFLLVQIVDPILQVSARVVLESQDLAETFAEYFHTQGYDIDMTVVTEVPLRDPVEESTANELVSLFNEFMKGRTLH